MTQLPLFDAPPPSNAPRVVADRANRPYGKGRPCTPFPPGSGPQGETCGGCVFLERVKHHEYHYLKCGLMKHAWTHGGGTDIKARWPACSEWEPSDAATVRTARAEGVLVAVYRRKSDPYDPAMDSPPFGTETVGDLWVWLDWMQEAGWRLLRPPGRSSISGWEVVK